MKKLLAATTAFLSIGVVGPLGVGIATADEPPPTPADFDRPGPARAIEGRGYALGGAHVMGIPYDEYIMRTGAEWFPDLNRQIVDYPAGQVQGHTLERLFPGIGRLDDNFPGLGIDGPSYGESIDVGGPNLLAAIREGGPGMAIGMSEGASVLDDVRARLANDPTAPPPDLLAFATYVNPVGKHAFGESFLS